MRRFDVYGKELQPTDANAEWFWCKKDDVDPLLAQLIAERDSYRQALVDIAAVSFNARRPVLIGKATREAFCTIHEPPDPECVTCQWAKQVKTTGDV